MPYFKHISYLALSFIVLCGLIGCSDDATQKTPESEGQTTAPSGQNPAPEKAKPTFPLVYVEELDQYQEFYKDQHTTSFSHVPSKNWFSFTAGKDGVLTKILLYGKANVVPNEYYGLSMSGFIREGNPLTGAKFGAWKLSRDDILNQLAAQSLTERDSGWITIRIRGEVPQEAGQTYFFVCDRIPEKSWFGEFAFGEGNPYKAGRNWLNSEHDLVFRTYVGKTKEHIEQTQMIRKLKELEDLKKNQSAPANAPPPSPIPVGPRPPDPSTFQTLPSANATQATPGVLPANNGSPQPPQAPSLSQPGVNTLPNPQFANPGNTLPARPILPEQNSSLLNRLNQRQ